MTKSDNESGRPECFGILEKVFPMSERGLRETPDECMYHCPVKTACLRYAVTGKKGAEIEEELIERQEKAGMIGFFERWSRKKKIERDKNKSE